MLSTRTQPQTWLPATPSDRRRTASVLVILPILLASQCLLAGIPRRSAAAAEIAITVRAAEPKFEFDTRLPDHLSVPPSFDLRGGLALDVDRPPPRAGRSSLVRKWLPPLLLVGALAAIQIGVDPPEEPRWTTHNRFDDGIRNGLRADTKKARRVASRASDVVFLAMGAGLVSDWYWLRDEYPIIDSLRIDGSWVLADAVTTRGIKLGAARERPFVPHCLGDPRYDPDCSDTTKHNDSFFSGHASTSATIAGLLCARHLHRSKRSRSDTLVCAAAASGGIATGVLRITADKHFALDVIAGWVSGALFGYLLPSHFHYTPGHAGPVTWKAFSPLVEPRLLGIRYGFQF
jgi:membrane-associated phospholipid phosphatase